MKLVVFALLCVLLVVAFAAEQEAPVKREIAPEESKDKKNEPTKKSYGDVDDDETGPIGSNYADNYYQGGNDDEGSNDQGGNDDDEGTNDQGDDDEDHHHDYGNVELWPRVLRQCIFVATPGNQANCNQATSVSGLDQIKKIIFHKFFFSLAFPKIKAAPSFQMDSAHLSLMEEQ